MLARAFILLAAAGLAVAQIPYAISCNSDLLVSYVTLTGAFLRTALLRFWSSQTTPVLLLA